MQIAPSQSTLDTFKLSTLFLFLLVGLLAVQPLSTDLYLPALPAIGKAFAASTVTVTLTLSALVGTFGLTQLFIGPLADRFGRRPVAIAGLTLYTLASLAAIWVPQIEWLIVCRALQGLGVACAYVVSRAIVRDLYAPNEGAKVLARGLMLMALGPVPGPFIGGALTSAFGWQGPFASLALFGLVLAAVTVSGLRETNLHLNPAATQLKPLFANYAQIARHPVFLSFTALSMASYASIFAFISGSSFVFIDIFSLSRTMYGAAFGLTGLAYLSGTALCRRLVPKRGVEGTVRLAAFASLSSGSLLAALSLLHVHHWLAVLLPQLGIMFAHGMQQPCSQTACIGPFPRMAGAASALNGFAQMAVAVVVAFWIGKSFNGTTIPMTLTVFAASVGVAFSALVLVKKHGKTT